MHGATSKVRSSSETVRKHRLQDLKGTSNPCSAHSLNWAGDDNAVHISSIDLPGCISKPRSDGLTHFLLMQCDQNCPALITLPSLSKITLTVQGSGTLTVHTERIVEFENEPSWLDAEKRSEAQALVLQNALQPGAVISNSEIPYTSATECLACPPGVVCSLPNV